MMRVFVTGATGFVGSAVVRELLDSGHQVVGLARSDKAASILTAAGAAVHRGSLDHLASLQSGAMSADGVIHLAFKHNFSDFGGAVETDLRGVKAMGAALEGTGKPFVITSGTMMLTYALLAGQLGTEKDVVGDSGPRGAAENAALALADKGVRSAVVRLAPSVHDATRAGWVAALTYIARVKAISAYIGDGLNRWPAVHRLDAAKLFRKAVESAPAGSLLHGVGDEGISLRDIAAAIGRRMKLPLVSLSREEAEAHFGFSGRLGRTVWTDNPTVATFAWHASVSEKARASHTYRSVELAKEFGPKDIVINCVAPGQVATDLFLNGKSPELVDSFRRMNAFGRLGEPEDIANALELLVSDKARWITGQTIRLNGGFN